MSMKKGNEGGKGVPVLAEQRQKSLSTSCVNFPHLFILFIEFWYQNIPLQSKGPTEFSRLRSCSRVKLPSAAGQGRLNQPHTCLCPLTQSLGIWQQVVLVMAEAILSGAIFPAANVLLPLEWRPDAKGCCLFLLPALRAWEPSASPRFPVNEHPLCPLGLAGCFSGAFLIYNFKAKWCDALS